MKTVPFDPMKMYRNAKISTLLKLIVPLSRHMNTNMFEIHLDSVISFFG